MSKKVIWIALAIVVIGGVIAFPKISLYLSSRTQSDNSAQVDFFIDKSLSLEELAEALKKEGVISNTNAFIKVGEYKELTKNQLKIK